MQSRFPNQRTLFASWHRQRDIQALNQLLVSTYYVLREGFLQSDMLLLQRLHGRTRMPKS
jgi:hypothetical protein